MTHFCRTQRRVITMVYWKISPAVCLNTLDSEQLRNKTASRRGIVGIAEQSLELDDNNSFVKLHKEVKTWLEV
jgi:hypothetical protein